jgi:hypothetical protein
MVNTELKCGKLFNRCMCLVMTLILDRLLSVVVKCHVMHSVIHSVKYCSKFFNHFIPMMSITADLGWHEVVIHIVWEAQGGSPISGA